MSLRQVASTRIPEPIKRGVRPLLRAFRNPPERQRAVITEPNGRLRPGEGPLTFVVGVGPRFDQNVPNAMMTCRMGFCRAFEEMGIPYLIVDVRDLVRVLPTVPNPFVCIFGSDFDVIDRRTVRLLKRHPLFVWVNPWFKGSDAFFAQHNLDPTIWTWTDQHLRKILDSEPGFVYTATVSKGLGFFEEWGNRGLKVVSLPLACDATLYSPSAPMRPEFEGVRMAFVGGYWESKGRQIDKYLRPFEAELTIYGYSPWPYRGYRGMLPRDAEPSLYRQARLSPTINEPTVRLLHGQINERVFKVLGCGGATVVDAVPAYRELFTEEELPIPQDEREFVEMARELLRDPVLREEQAQRGLRAVTNRHTYEDRARVVLDRLGLGKPAERASDKKDDSVHRHA